MSMSLVETVSSIYQFFEGTDNVVDENAVFQEPRIYRHDHKKCDICFPLIALGGCEASIPSALLFPEHKPFKIKIGLEKVIVFVDSRLFVFIFFCCSFCSNLLTYISGERFTFRKRVLGITHRIMLKISEYIMCGFQPERSVQKFNLQYYMWR